MPRRSATPGRGGGAAASAGGESAVGSSDANNLDDATSTGDHVHGQGGVYNGGEWVPIEECDRLLKDGKWRDCETCPSSMPSGDDTDFDVAIIGAGCVGAAIARELSRFSIRTVLLEKSDDVTQGATKANSGIVHAGYDDKPGTNRAKYCWPGNQMYPQLDRELRFGFIKNGSLVVIRSEEQMEILEDLMMRAKKNGVKNCRIIGQEELRRVEPNIAKDALAALHSPDAGTVTPYEFTIALAENAAFNGVDVRVNTEVLNVEGSAGDFTIHTRHVEPPRGGGEAKAKPGFQLWELGAAGAVVAALVGFALASELLNEQQQGAVFAVAALVAVGIAVRAFTAPSGAQSFANVLKQQREGAFAAARAAASGKVTTQTLKAKYVVNAAGLFADVVARMVGDDSFNIKPRLGEYLLLHKDQGKFIRHVIFPAPGKMGKGVVAQPTLWGNLLLGPLARELHDPATATASPVDLMKTLIVKTRETYPAFDAGKVIHSFTGARAKSDRGDWIIEVSSKCPGFVHAAGIDSPGLAGSPAIALEVVRLLKGEGLETPVNRAFNPYRRPIIVPKHTKNNGWTNGLRLKSDDPTKRVVCKCEMVTEAEVVDAIHRPLLCESTQAVRKRTRAGMGHCQGTYCEKIVHEIIARETNKPPAEVPKRPWPESSLLPERWPGDDFKTLLRNLVPEDD